jgi:hypothetical protein
MLARNRYQLSLSSTLVRGNPLYLVSLYSWIDFEY